MKKIVEDAKRSGWNNQLQPRLKLVHDVETRFGTTFIMVEWFIGSAYRNWVVMMKQMRDGSYIAHGSMERNRKYSGLELCFLLNKLHRKCSSSLPRTIFFLFFYLLSDSFYFSSFPFLALFFGILLCSSINFYFLLFVDSTMEMNLPLKRHLNLNFR